MKNEIYEELRMLSKKIEAQKEAPALPEQLRDAQRIYELLLIANYLSEKEAQKVAPEPIADKDVHSPKEPAAYKPKTPKTSPDNRDDAAQKSGTSDSPARETPANEPPREASKTPSPESPPVADNPPLAEKTKEKPEPKSKVESTPKPPANAKRDGKDASLNSRLRNSTIEIGLNDRIAFVKHLFDGKPEDFNRVLSQLNTYTSLEESENFIKNLVKPDYNWEDKEEYENRLLSLVYRKFGEEME